MGAKLKDTAPITKLIIRRNMTRKGTVVFIDNKKEESYEIEVVKDGVYFRLKGHTIFVPHQQIKRIKFHD